jgi:hypothetical protein
LYVCTYVCTHLCKAVCMFPVTQSGAKGQLNGFLISVLHTVGFLGQIISFLQGLFMRRKTKHMETKNRCPWHYGLDPSD